MQSNQSAFSIECERLKELRWRFARNSRSHGASYSVVRLAIFKCFTLAFIDDATGQPNSPYLGKRPTSSHRLRCVANSTRLDATA